MEYKSIATWTKIKKSEDTHSSKEQAEGVCKMLLERWGPGKSPCEIRGNCTSAIAVPNIKKELNAEEVVKTEVALYMTKEDERLIREKCKDSFCTLEDVVQNLFDSALEAFKKTKNDI